MVTVFETMYVEEVVAANCSESFFSKLDFFFREVPTET